MKTSQYYRLDEKVGGMRGGKSFGKTLEGAKKSFKSGVGKVKHSIASPFKKTFQKSGVGMNAKELLEKPKGTKNKIKRFFTTKSARYRQAANAATGITKKSRKRIAKILKNTTPSTKRETQMKKIIGKINPSVNTSKMTYNDLKTKLTNEYAGKKEAYRQTFASLNKTKPKFENLKKNTEALTEAGNKLDTVRTALQGLNKTNNNYKQTKKQYNKAFSEKTKAEKAFKTSKKIWNAHDKKKGSINALINHSKKQTMGKRAGRTLKKAAVVGAVAVAPLPTLAVMGAYGARKGYKKLRNKVKSKKSFIQNYTSETNIKKKEKIAKRIRKKYDSPENRETILRKISEGKKLTDANKLTLDLNKSYDDFKADIETLKLTDEQKETLKDYHKATKITEIINKSNESMSKSLTSATNTIAAADKAAAEKAAADKAAADKAAADKAVKLRAAKKFVFDIYLNKLRTNNITIEQFASLKALQSKYNFNTNGESEQLISQKESALGEYITLGPPPLNKSPNNLTNKAEMFKK